MKKITALLLAVLMVFTLAACNNTKAPVSDSAVAGSYVLVSESSNGTVLPEEEISDISFTLNDDNTGVYTIGGTAIQITWAQEGNTVTFTAGEDGPSDPLVLTLDGDKLIVADDLYEMVFQKQ